MPRAGIISDSAVTAIDKKREAHSAAKSMGFCLSRHQRCFEGDVEPHSNDVRKRKMTLNFTVGRLRCSRIPPRFRQLRNSGYYPVSEIHCRNRENAAPRIPYAFDFKYRLVAKKSI